MKQRLQSLDVMRGLTVALMILVNNGVGHEQFTTLRHSPWNGLTLCDLVFPFFLFMVGVSLWLSRKRLTPGKIMTRTVRLFLVGVLLHVWDMLLDGKWAFWHDLRLWGVLQRIALCYCVTAFIVLHIKPHRYIIAISLILVAYALLLLYGNGYVPDASNVLCRTDRWLLGEPHLYRKSPIDPEGLLSTLPAIAHTLLGVLSGWILTARAATRRLLSLLTFHLSLLATGLCLSPWLPLNKRVWSPSYVLVTCGLATLLLACLIFVEQRSGSRAVGTRVARAAKPVALLLTAFGTNAFFLYVLSEMAAPVASHLALNTTTYAAMLRVGLAPRMASLCYALLFDGAIAVVAWWLWKRKIFVKV